MAHRQQQARRRTARTAHLNLVLAFAVATAFVVCTVVAATTPASAGTQAPLDVYLPLIERALTPTPTQTSLPATPPPTLTPTATATKTPTRAPTATATKPPRTGCDASYPTVCIPPPPPDLDCTDVPYENFVVLPPDPHNFDRDHDGVGCEA